MATRAAHFRFSVWLQRRRLQVYSFMLLVLLPGLLWMGCQRKSGSPLEHSRAVTQGTLELEISSAPDPWSFVEHGRTLIEGIITTQLGLDPDQPCVVIVKDIVAGFERRVIIDPSSGQHPNSAMPLEGGAFRIDIVNDFRIADDGYKVLTLEFNENGGGKLFWRVPVDTGPFWEELARSTAIAGARRTYGARMLPLLSQYRRFLEIVRERGGLAGFDEDAILFDLQVTALLEETFAEALIVHPDMKEWYRIADDLERRYTDLLEIGQPVSQAEQTYRGWIQAATISPEAEDLRTEYSLTVAKQFTWGGPGGPGSPPTESLWDLALLRHTYGFATVTETESALTYEASIRIDDGLVRYHCCDEPPPYVEPAAGTWAQTDPVFTLVVRLEDTDEDGAWDLATCTGTAQGTPLEDLNEADPIPFQGHLLTPLGNLVFCDFWAPLLTP